MRKTVRRRYDAHVRTHRVCTEHSAVFDASAGGTKTRTALGAQVAEIAQLFAIQSRAVEERRAATVLLRQLRIALREAAHAVVRIGRLVNIDDTTMATMQFPGAVTDDELIAYGRGLLDRVSGHADAFEAEGLPPNLLTNLAARIEDISRARDSRDEARQRFAAATEAIREALARADKAVNALESIAVNTPEAVPEVIKKLRMARRVGPRAAEPPATPAPAPGPPSAPTDKAA